MKLCSGKHQYFNIIQSHSATTPFIAHHWRNVIKNRFFLPTISLELPYAIVWRWMRNFFSGAVRLIAHWYCHARATNCANSFLSSPYQRKRWARPLLVAGVGFADVIVHTPSVNGRFTTVQHYMCILNCSWISYISDIATPNRIQSNSIWASPLAWTWSLLVHIERIEITMVFIRCGWARKSIWDTIVFAVNSMVYMCDLWNH